MTELPNAPISPAETQILSLIWQLKQATVQQVLDNLPKERDITYATVQTLLRRLEKKGYIKHISKGKAHHFFAAVKQKDVVSKKVSDFLDRLFGGDSFPLMQYLAEHGKLTADDIGKLKNIINKQKTEGNKTTTTDNPQ